MFIQMYAKSVLITCRFVPFTLIAVLMKVIEYLVTPSTDAITLNSL